MARFLFVVPPLVGHVNPTVAVAKQLAERGHRVAWVGYPGKIRGLLPEGAELYALDDDEYAGIEAGFASEALQARGLQSWVLMWQKLIVPLARAMLPGVDKTVDAFEPDLLCVDQLAIGGALCARLRDLPWATLSTSAAGALVSPAEGLPRVWEFVTEQMAELQREAGLPLVERADNSPRLVIVFMSREFMGSGDFPDHFRFVGPSLAARPGEIDFPWEQLGKRPRVLVSLGTLNAERGGRFFKTVFEALGSEPRGQKSMQVVLVAPPDRVGSVPGNFIVRPFVPQLDLLPRMDVVVSHAGQNTVSESLAHGLPLVVAPIKDDQPVVASLVVEAGAGIRLKFGRMRPAQLANAVSRLLNEPDYRRAAERLQASFQAAGGAGRAADLLLALL